MRNLVTMTLIGILGLHASCNKPKSNRSVGSPQGAEAGSAVGAGGEKLTTPLDMSRELSPDLADNLNATQSSLDTVAIGANVGASFKFGTTAVFDIGGGMKYEDMFQRQVLNEVIVGRAKDVDGTDASTGVFIDKDTVAANRYIKCKSQKVISDSNSFSTKASAGISFLGLELGTRVGTGRKLSTSTDYTMNRGYYRTTEPMALSRIFELCSNLAKNDIALQNINHISEVIKLNFSSTEMLEEVAKKIARGEKANNFQFHNMRMDFQILKKSDGEIVFTVHPDTHYADPTIDVTVSFRKDDSRVVVLDVSFACKGECQNYVDTKGNHGLKGVGSTDLKKVDAEKYMKMAATLFTAVAFDSK